MSRGVAPPWAWSVVDNTNVAPAIRVHPLRQLKLRRTHPRPVPQQHLERPVVHPTLEIIGAFMATRFNMIVAVCIFSPRSRYGIPLPPQAVEAVAPHIVRVDPPPRSRGGHAEDDATGCSGRGKDLEDNDVCSVEVVQGKQR